VPSEAGTVTAYLEAGLQADVEKCWDGWCRLSGRGFAGWIAQAELWGVYPGEEIP
jgi:SH3-like domain-containing protein